MISMSPKKSFIISARKLLVSDIVCLLVSFFFIFLCFLLEVEHVFKSTNRYKWLCASILWIEKAWMSAVYFCRVVWLSIYVSLPPVTFYHFFNFVNVTLKQIPKATQKKIRIFICLGNFLFAMIYWIFYVFSSVYSYLNGFHQNPLKNSSQYDYYIWLLFFFDLKCIQFC